MTSGIVDGNKNIPQKNNKESSKQQVRRTVFFHPDKRRRHCSILIGVEQEADGRKSVLALEDMTNLISVYDAVRQLLGMG